MSRKVPRELTNSSLAAFQDPAQYDSLNTPQNVRNNSFFSSLATQAVGDQVTQGVQVTQEVQELLGSSVLAYSILQDLQNQTLRKAIIAPMHNVQVRTESFSRAFSQLLKLGLIEQTEEKNRSSNQAYRITAVGRSFLESKNKTN